MRDFFFHGVKSQNELFIARDPVDDGISHILKISRLFLADLHISLRWLL